MTLTSLAPVVPEPGDDLAISGVRHQHHRRGGARRPGAPARVADPGAQPGRDRARSSPATAGRTGIAIERTRTDVTASLQPGAARLVHASASRSSALPLSEDTNEVIVLGVESIARTGQDAPVQTGFTRTFLPWFPAPDAVEAHPRRLALAR